MQFSKKFWYSCGLGLSVLLVSPLVTTQVLAEEQVGDQQSGSPAMRVSPGFTDDLISQADPSQDRFDDIEVVPEFPSGDSEIELMPPPVDVLPPADASQRFEVRRIEVFGSTVFSDEDLADIIQPYENRELTASDLQDAANEITNYYFAAGYLTSRAEVPEQTITDGTVRIDVIEGRLSDIRVEGTERLTNYVRSRIALAGVQPVHASQLEGRLRLLRDEPLFDEVTADLTRGDGPGESILVVTVKEANAFQGSIAADTQSPLSVGRYRAGARLEYQNLAGLGDRLSASAYTSTTEGSKSYELAYQIPVNPMNGTVLFRAAPSNFRITNLASTGGLSSRGETDIYEFVYRQPLIRNYNEELALSLGFRYRDGSTVLNDVVTTPTKTSVFTFGQDYLRRDAQGAWVLQSQFRLGTGLFDATTRPAPQPDGQFLLWAGQAQRLQRFSPGSRHLFVMQADWQFTGDNLIGSEQFFIGGPRSVRGYYQNQGFGDSGFRVSMSDYIRLSPSMQLVPFVDAGYAWRTDGGDNFLLGTGLGLTLNPVDDLSASVDLGIPIVSTSGAPDALVDFNLRYRF